MPKISGSTAIRWTRRHRGNRIANARGVPGTLGCIARTTHDHRAVFLTNWHVLFGNGAGGSDTAWLIDDAGDARRYTAIGRALHGKIGNVRFNDADYYVDCAVGSCIDDSPVAVAAYATAMPGERVTKRGAATGTTTGVIVDAAYCGSACTDGRTHPTPRQLLIRSLQRNHPFSADGDSGAVIVNARNAVVGLLWGTNCHGEGVACHIAPVMQALNITLDATGA